MVELLVGDGSNEEDIGAEAVEVALCIVKHPWRY